VMNDGTKKACALTFITRHSAFVISCYSLADAAEEIGLRHARARRQGALED
jgi:hypothetical protein